ncbi:MAG: hypothetical protein PVJ20_05750 [Desulfobacterales bacterium]|jgi:hypothetical protein
MNKIKLLLLTLTIIVLATTLFTNICGAAQVTKINEDKGQVFIDEGKGAGFEFGVKVCFFSSIDKELICGKVLRTTDSYAIVRIRNRRKTKEIEIGSETMLHVEKENKE